MSAAARNHVQTPARHLPRHWVDHDATQYRACDLCRSGRTAADGQRLCAHADVTWAERGVPVARARATGGACGPEALHLNFPGLE